MIPLDVTPEQRDTYVRNIIRAYQKTTKEQRIQGESWYRNALSLATFLDESNPRRAAGILAALSANKRWADNVDLAVKAFTGEPGGHTNDTVEKVRRILSGEEPSTVLPVGRKTWWFFLNIMNPDDGNIVVVDRHAHDIAVGELYDDRNRGLSTIRRYDILADAYREAGRKLAKLPSHVQATTWVARTEGK